MTSWKLRHNEKEESGEHARQNWLVEQQQRRKEQLSSCFLPLCGIDARPRFSEVELVPFFWKEVSVQDWPALGCAKAMLLVIKL